MIKRKFSTREKARLGLASLAEGTNVSEFCAKHKISRSTIYAWQKAILALLAKEL